MIHLFLFSILIVNIYCAIVLYFILKQITKTTSIKPEEREEKKDNKRSHAKLASNSFSSPLNPYDRYKDKSTNLYAPRKQGGGVKIEVEEK